MSGSKKRDLHSLGRKDVLVFIVTEHCDPYRDDRCDFNRVLATYQVELEAASLGLSKKRIR